MLHSISWIQNNPLIQIGAFLPRKFGLMECVESRKLSEAQNCPARALFSFIQDLSTSVTSSANIADTVKMTTKLRRSYIFKLGTKYRFEPVRI